MANIVKLKRSGTANTVPSANSLEYGELAINYADGTIFYKDASNTIVSFDVSGVFKVDISDLAVSQAMDCF